jgi:hypothetical protein
MAGVKHGDASEGFSNEELRIILEEADGMSVWLKGRGDDPNFMGRLVRFILYTGVHVSVLSGAHSHKSNAKDSDEWIPARGWLTSKCLSERIAPSGEKRMFIVYRRPKKRTDNITHVPVSKEIAPWVAEFLDQKRPHSRVRYNQLLLELQAKLHERGLRIHLNPHRFRHAAMRLLSQEFQLDMEDVERITATSRGTLDRYAKKTVDQIADELAGKNW